MDAETRARELIAGGATIEEVISGLRAAGFSRMVSASGLMKATRMNRSEVFRAVLGSPVWADQLDTLYDWIEPPERPDATTLAQLRAVCAAEPRLAEVWIHGSQTFVDDGQLLETTQFAFVFDPPLGEADDDASLDELFEFTRALTECWPLPPGGQRGYGTAAREVLATRAEHCLEVFRRDVP